MKKEQILYEDKELIVCYKPAQIATQTARVGQPDMVSEVTNYLATSGGMRTEPYVGVLHRLDQPVEGILVFAKNRNAARILSEQIADGQMKKHYYAVVFDKHFQKDTDAGFRKTLVDYLLKDGKTNSSAVVSSEQKGAKRAELSYEVQKRMSIREYCTSETLLSMDWETADIEIAQLALAEIELITGRHHQIRVQMSHAGMSLLGDYKYADGQARRFSELIGQKQAALCAYKIGLKHPATGKQLWFQRMPQGQIFQKFL